MFGRIFTTDSFHYGNLCFSISISSWFSLDRVYVSNNLSSSSRLYILLTLIICSGCLWSLYFCGVSITYLFFVFWFFWGHLNYFSWRVWFINFINFSKKQQCVSLTSPPPPFFCSLLNLFLLWSLLCLSFY